MFCYKCGNQLPDTAVFCNKCGVKAVNDKTWSKRDIPISVNFATIEQTPTIETVIIAGKHYDISNTTKLHINTAITDADMMNIVKLVNLTSLHLEGLNICNITLLARLVNLTELDLSFNQISDLTPLSCLPNLTDLWLLNNNIKDVTPISILTKLSFLSLSFNKICDITPLANLTNLNWLGLDHNRISSKNLQWLITQLPQCNILTF